MIAGDARTLAPLADFYIAAGRPLPAVETVGHDDLPPMLRDLLSAPRPLTPRLEDHHGEALALRVLERRRDGERYARRIVLVRRDGVPVVLGALALDLTRLSPSLRAAVLAEEVPFGHILATATAKPDALLRVVCDALIADALALSPRRDLQLYGRRRTLVDASGAIFASIVELLPPEPPSTASKTGS